jgi:hypothetical protein
LLWGSLFNPSFSPDEAQVVLELNWSDRMDLAIVGLTDGIVAEVEELVRIVVSGDEAVEGSQA